MKFDTKNDYEQEATSLIVKKRKQAIFNVVLVLRIYHFPLTIKVHDNNIILTHLQRIFVLL